MARDSLPAPELQTSPAHPRRALPALALPRGREDRRVGAALSILLHVLVIALLVTPIAAGHELVERAQGAGGPGPAGGGGGGRGGTGGQVKEQLQFVLVAPPPAAATVPTPAVQPPVQPPLPVVKPPEPVVAPPVVQAPVVDEKPSTTKPLDVAATLGVGGGSGKDGTSGNGPGSGGGVGSGIGTGRGSGIGPGTGGGTQANYPPSPIELFMPPMPVPGAVQGTHVIAEFDVDETGRVLSVEFTPTRDRGYNKRLDEVFRSFKFRPGTRPDGTPIRMKYQLVVDL